eukprot:m.36801 g.36801  ORF g.36801 m.36801 type:complete len:428 (-) comp5409_c0_seq1:4089-5372(-)
MKVDNADDTGRAAYLGRLLGKLELALHPHVANVLDRSLEVLQADRAVLGSQACIAADVSLARELKEGVLIRLDRTLVHALDVIDALAHALGLGRLPVVQIGQLGLLVLGQLGVLRLGLPHRHGAAALLLQPVAENLRGPDGVGDRGRHGRREIYLGIRAQLLAEWTHPAGIVRARGKRGTRSVHADAAVEVAALDDLAILVAGQAAGVCRVQPLKRRATRNDARHLPGMQRLGGLGQVGDVVARPGHAIDGPRDRRAGGRGRALVLARVVQVDDALVAAGLGVVKIRIGQVGALRQRQTLVSLGLVLFILGIRADSRIPCIFAAMLAWRRLVALVPLGLAVGVVARAVVLVLAARLFICIPRMLVLAGPILGWQLLRDIHGLRHVIVLAPRRTAGSALLRSQWRLARRVAAGLLLQVAAVRAVVAAA